MKVDEAARSAAIAKFIIFMASVVLVGASVTVLASSAAAGAGAVGLLLYVSLVFGGKG